MPSFSSLRKALGAILLIAVCAVLLQGVVHEAFHESEQQQHSALFAIDSECEHEEACHSHHKACSRLSCSQGTPFITGKAFCWHVLGQVEAFLPTTDNFTLPIIAENFFKPPRSFVG